MKEISYLDIEWYLGGVFSDGTVVLIIIDAPKPIIKAKKYTHQAGKLNTTDTKRVIAGMGNTWIYFKLLLIAWFLLNSSSLQGGIVYLNMKNGGYKRISLIFSPNDNLSHFFLLLSILAIVN